MNRAQGYYWVRRVADDGRPVTEIMEWAHTWDHRPDTGHWYTCGSDMPWVDGPEFTVLAGPLEAPAGG